MIGDAILDYLNAEIKKELTIIDLHSPFTLVQVEIPYLNKTIEVKVPNNIQEGHKIRVKGLGYSDNSGNRGDLYLVVTKINYFNEKKAGDAIMQKMIVVRNNDFEVVNRYLEQGWQVKEFKPFKDSPYVYIYVLLEKIKREN